MTLAVDRSTLNRMADQPTRLRVAAMFAALFALAYTVIAVLGEPSQPYSRTELRHVSGLPYAPPQIQRRIAPSAVDPAELEQQVDQLQRLLNGESPQPTPTASR